MTPTRGISRRILCPRSLLVCTVAPELYTVPTALKPEHHCFCSTSAMNLILCHFYNQTVKLFVCVNGRGSILWCQLVAFTTTVLRISRYYYGLQWALAAWPPRTWRVQKTHLIFFDGTLTGEGFTGFRALSETAPLSWTKTKNVSHGSVFRRCTKDLLYKLSCGNTSCYH